MYSYIDYYDSDYTLTTLVVDSDDITYNDFCRADFPLIFICQFIVVLMFLWVFNHLTRIAHKGGIAW